MAYRDLNTSHACPDWPATNLIGNIHVDAPRSAILNIMQRRHAGMRTTHLVIRPKDLSVPHRPGLPKVKLDAEGPGSAVISRRFAIKLRAGPGPATSAFPQRGQSIRLQARSLKDLLLILEKIDKSGAGFRSVTEHVDTTTPAGRMMMQMLGSFAEFERSMIRERTRAGLAAAKEDDRVGGRPRSLNDKQRREIADAVLSGRKTAADMARLFGVSARGAGRNVVATRVGPTRRGRWRIRILLPPTESRGRSKK